jgi:hypothetical protein
MLDIYSYMARGQDVCFSILLMLGIGYVYSIVFMNAGFSVPHSF